jgi:hypothetical protein
MTTAEGGGFLRFSKEKGCPAGRWHKNNDWAGYPGPYLRPNPIENRNFGQQPNLY